MKHFVLFCFAITFLFNNTLFAQNNDFPKKQLKFYLNTINEGYVENRASSNDRFLKNITKVGVPSLAYAWQKSENKWHELEFSAFFDRNQNVSAIGNAVTENFTERLNYVSARYEWNKILFDSEKIDFSIGGSFRMFYLYNSLEPMISTDFPLYYNGLHNDVSIIPRMRFKFDRFALDFNTPFSVMKLNLISFREENPSLSRLEQTQGGINYELFPGSYFLQIRAGIAVDLN